MIESKKQARCPQCSKPAVIGPENRWRPFCSRQCKLIDFGDWLDEFGLDPEMEIAETKTGSHDKLS